MPATEATSSQELWLLGAVPSHVMAATSFFCSVVIISSAVQLFPAVPTYPFIYGGLQCLVPLSGAVFILTPDL